MNLLGSLFNNPRYLLDIIPFLHDSLNILAHHIVIDTLSSQRMYFITFNAQINQINPIFLLIHLNLRLQDIRHQEWRGNSLFNCARSIWFLYYRFNHLINRQDLILLFANPIRRFTCLRQLKSITKFHAQLMM